MAVSDLITSARYQIPDTDTNRFTGAELLDYINRGYKLIWSQLIKQKSDWVRKSYTQALVVGTDNYALPADFYSVDFLQIDGEEANLAPVYMDFIETYSVNIGSSAGTPAVYSIHNGYFYLKPTPDATYNLLEYYFYKSGTLDSADTTPFNGMADEALIAFVVGMAQNRDERNVQRNDQIVSSLLGMSNTLFKRRDKIFKRVNAYRWEYEGMV